MYKVAFLGLVFLSAAAMAEHAGFGEKRLVSEVSSEIEESAKAYRKDVNEMFEAGIKELQQAGYTVGKDHFKKSEHKVSDLIDRVVLGISAEEDKVKRKSLEKLYLTLRDLQGSYMMKLTDALDITCREHNTEYDKTAPLFSKSLKALGAAYK